MATINTVKKASRTRPSSGTQPLMHPIVGDRIIDGEGTSADTWQAWQRLAELRRIDVKTYFPAHQRVCIIAPHPDDEILGCAGLMQQLAVNGNRILLVSVTNGTMSHPASTKYPREVLNQLRPQETRQALKQLNISEKVEHLLLDIPDGEVLAYQDILMEKLSSIITSSDILVPTFRYDGHPDHEITGAVVLEYAKKHQLTCYQVLIWALHWASPEDRRIDWQNIHRLDLNQEQQRKKRQAIACFHSQITADNTTNQAPVLPQFAIDRATQGWELYLHDSP